ncbi:MAG: tRNA (adenosine(37)-N6)-threonylcarbamoyltransferase complex transferase subunit TsaD [Desulfonauticus sp.]|nr:tRNA (adenosine(37)-N6)-threonylcarbamoyltransferase complex transferase subunit TsaD [Desulfonauticus sp.]
MLTLGIETSCDETGLALVEGGKVVAEVLASQADMHAVFGGVVPELASREHLKVLPGLLNLLLEKSGCKIRDIELVAVTRGPGLLASLLIGLGFAKGVSLGLNVNLIGINHLYAHLLVANLEQKLEFPCLGLLVSGGHTHLYLLKSFWEIELLGKTLDDAIGEAFDKVAKMINLPYPGGVFIDRLATKGVVDKSLFPRPYIDNTNLDFSFSGIKTAVANFLAQNRHLIFSKEPDVGKLEELAPQELKNMCASFSYALVESLKIKVARSLNRLTVKGIVVAGGVACNSFLRKAFGDFSQGHNIKCWIPSPDLCSDNGVMVAYLGEILGEKGLRHDLDLEAIPRGRPIPWDYISAE